MNTKRRKDKQGIAGEIIDKVKRRGGRFLEKVEVQRLSQKSGTMQNVTVWHEVDHRKTLLLDFNQKGLAMVNFARPFWLKSSNSCETVALSPSKSA